MKKIISLILAAVMLLALGVSALATEILPDSDMTVLQVTVRKHWYDNDEKAHHDDVLADIYVDGKLVQTVTLGENNNWEAVTELSVDPIPVGEKSNFIDNKVKIVERSIAGYKSEVYGPYEVGFYGNRGEIAYDITNSKMVRIEIPVSVTVKQTGNVVPSSHTFYYLQPEQTAPTQTALTSRRIQTATLITKSATPARSSATSRRRSPNWAFCKLCSAVWNAYGTGNSTVSFVLPVESL